jgi:two-component system sensor histidine kinase KdpD
LINTSLRKLDRELSKHKIIVAVSPDMPLVKLDFVLMEQVITNLLHNASLYTPPDSKIQINAFVEGQECALIISDNGPGFPKDAIPRIFEKFYRVPGSKAGGTGLGLSIVQGFIAAHNGTIKVENKKNGGAEFIIKFPLQSLDQNVVKDKNE